MRAVVCERPNSPWVIKELPDPSPGPGQVLIRMRASGMCSGDLLLYDGNSPYPTPTPCIGGHEPSGDIIALGSGVTSKRVGDRVVVVCPGPGCGRCEACQAELPCVMPDTWTLAGGNAELIVASAQGCLVIPQSVACEDAAPVFCGGFTTMTAVRLGAIQKGERVAVLGIGGIGHMAIQCSKALGFETIALTRSADKSEEARQLGADEVVITGDDPGAALHKIGGADVILSTLEASEPVARAMGGLRSGGRLVSIGLCGNIQLDTNQMLVNQTQFKVCHTWKSSDLTAAMTLLAQNKLKPMVELYPLERVNEVIARLRAGKVRYRAVLQHR